MKTIKERAKEAARKEFGASTRLSKAVDYMAGYIKGATDQRTIDEEELKHQWTSVKDRMPTEEGRYLCMVDDYDVHEVVDFINGYFNIDAPVEYWMPLPEHPKTKH